MAMKKTANKIAVSFEIQCWSCGDPIPSANGSLFWTVADIQVAHKSGDTEFYCNCGSVNEIPTVS